METQILMTFVLALLAVVFTTVGIYVVIVLKELRVTIQKANQILDNVNSVTNAVANPLAVVSGIVKGIKIFRNLNKE